MKVKYSEEVILFGADDNLVGILSKPSHTPVKAPVLIIVNAGVLHRVGPCRFSVKLARGLASQGVTVFRFDYSGVGDSGFGELGPDLQENHTAELIQAMDALEQDFLADRFVIHGLCSGARDAFHAALSDKRVMGVSQVDGYSYRTAKYYWIKVKEKLSSVGEFIGFVKRRIAAVFNWASEDDTPSATAEMTVAQWPDAPSCKTVAEGYRELAARGVRFVVVYTGAWQDTYNYESQFFDMYSRVDFCKQAKLIYMPESDHIMTNPIHSQQLTSAISWLLHD
jgi:hypothetical protein